MRRYVFSLFAALTVMSAGSVEGQGGPSSAPLELSQVLRSAERHHPRIMAAVAREAIARSELLAARGGFDPELEVDARVRTGGYYELRRIDVQITQPTPLWGAEVYAGYRIGRGVEQGRYPSYYSDQTRDGGELRAGVRIPIWRDGVLDERRARRSRAAIGVETAQERRSATLLRLRRAATDAYFAWVAAGRRAQVAEQLLELAQARRRWVDARVAAGAVAEVESLEAERSLLRRRASRISARRAVERTALGLSLYLRGEDGAPSIPDARALPRRLSLPEAIPDDDFGPTTRGADLRAALQCHPRVAQKLAELDAARITRDLARAQRAPRLDATFQHSRDFGAGPDSLGRSVFEAGLVFSMPLAMRSSRGRLAAAESQVNVLEEELRLIEDELLMRLANARSAGRNAGEQFAVASALLDTSERLAAAERSRFEAGATSLFVVNQREQALARAALAQVDAARELWQARAAWQATATCGDSPR